MHDLIDFFIEETTIRNDIAARFSTISSAVKLERDRQTGWFIEQLQSRQITDLATLVGQTVPDLPAEEKGELFLRLVQSMVAFTGIALEWHILAVASDGVFRHKLRIGEDVRAYLHESQRMFPTSWRLIRTAARDHTIGRVSVKKGDDIIVATTAIHRSRKDWDDSMQFDPARWRSERPSQKRGYVPFGRGPGMCPGREFAITSLEFALRQIVLQHDVVARRQPFHRPPYVRSILSPPRREFRFVPRDRSA